VQDESSEMGFVYRGVEPLDRSAHAGADARDGAGSEERRQPYLQNHITRALVNFVPFVALIFLGVK
jgi:hypothetical protein